MKNPAGVETGQQIRLAGQGRQVLTVPEILYVVVSLNQAISLSVKGHQFL